ncbi:MULTISPECIES: sigma-54-dependent transcriptional regulator [Flavobacterium]|jgi:DNA-binding NtrC family response regulator|uniref:Two component, sigma54 specific, transcriptional regulator, Fis family n=1 Tax=Flavobacterium johnsoniae (strain ATCC 17061 / DSM 2064 / JCM 8514 / BCRC 14874 / CCUG 350202 / NBRC 14942 / NCIMB 11054 / UW101) TaxID=376686 RepID=A5F9S0_FLAJ1|nr:MULTISPECIES: sigma-54 dependent transcriptional regulator [Flavobacterium]ABQ08046.1 putative two component, sigma54 specific, transcriptional regulator, Fis family [Flavobacterium johnsoniae UW101]OXG02121.1 response regulator [Flavobacterium johnsoniae UW101]WDF58792.1 sigma-54 dependent transcriptional regulator [Flavobacterium sp. KACC 22758]WQG80108.1 sigma-54 dependent transcriptional regulator [Flavobacterium johnsoniae UW101]SHK93787.1 DNA-binding transcriptional response regulator
MSKILIIEDEAAIRRVLVKILSEENDSYQVDEAEDGAAGLEKIKNNDYDLVLCDIKMPKMDGVEVLEEAKKIKPEIPMVMISGHGDMETAIQTMRLGAFDYISKPPDLNRLLNTVRNALDKKQLVVENKILKKKVSKNYEMIGESESINHIKVMIDKVAPTEARVLITGPNGTGKELVAHQLHEKSERSGFPLIEVNCAAIPSELIESELFGHVKGAFTSAVKDRAGKFEAADKGTIFLDEIGDMSLSAQAKVLRALQESMITRVGADKDIKVDVRVVAATNKDLKTEIAEGRFREDLYHRLAVILIKVPPLNERRDDIPALISHFAEKIASEQGNAVKGFSAQAIQLLQEYDWTGNIRELRNVVERLIILGGSEISENDVKMFASK